MLHQFHSFSLDTKKNAKGEGGRIFPANNDRSDKSFHNQFIALLFPHCVTIYFQCDFFACLVKRMSAYESQRPSSPS